MVEKDRMKSEADFMRVRPVFSLVLSMSLPMVVSMLVNSLYNIVDSYFVAAISEEAMTALSLVYPVQNFITSVAVGFGVGINAMIAFYSGAGDRRSADRSATLGLILAIIHSLILTILSISLMPSFLGMFTSSESIMDYGLRYSLVAFAFTPINIIGITFEKIFQAVGRMKASMMALMSGCIANIILDPVFIFGLGPFPELGIEGAAFATGLGQLIALIVYLLVSAVHPLSVRITKKELKADWHLIARLYMIGVPATLNMALPSFLVSMLNAILSVYSEVYILILGIYYKLQTFLYLPASGFVQGMRPIIGYNYGAGEHGRVVRIFLTVLLMCALIMLFGMVLSLLLPEELIAIFSDNPETIRIGAAALRIISIGFVVSSVSVAASGALEGLGKGVPSLVISLLRYVIMIIPLSYLLCRVLGAGPDGVWHSFWISELATAIIAIPICRKAFRFR